MPDPADLPLLALLTVFAATAAAIAVAGTRLARIADELAVRTRLGEALIGATFVGASTSLPGVITSVVTAGQGHVGIATGNALGGIAAQTAFLAVADVAYRKANLEHAAASVANLVQGALLISLLTIPLVASTLPSIAIYGVSPATVLLILAYAFGMRMVRQVGSHPMWRARPTRETQREADEQPDRSKGSTRSLWLWFGGLVVILAVAGFAVSQTGIALAQRTGLSGTAVGTLLTAVVTSLPELVIAVAAVRAGAINLAVGNVIGGNCFDVLFLAGADIAYRPGSLYTAFGDEDTFLASATILMISVLLLGLLYRQRRGLGGIGFESAIVLAAYALVIVGVAI